MKKIVLYLITLFMIAACGGIQVLDGPSPEDLYTEKFMIKINAIKSEYRQGKEETALSKLMMMNEDALMSSEKAMRRNLIGAIYFSMSEYEKAIMNFDLAASIKHEDVKLKARVNLNLASSYYRLGNMEKTYLTLESINPRQMEAHDKKMFYLLRYKVSKELNKNNEEVDSLIMYLASYQKLQSLKDDQYFQFLINSYSKLDQRTRLRILESYDEENLCVSYLAYLETEKLYYSGAKDDAESYLEWVSEKSQNFPEILSLVDDFVFKIGNYAKIDPKAIGVVLPFNGNKKKYSKRILAGIDSALKAQFGNEYKLYIEDSKGSSAVGAQKVKSLIEKKHVSAIIGGLFANEAKSEYQEAKKHGTFFVSISDVHLPRESKDHLLVEIPGSVESQVNAVFSDDLLNFLGKRGAIVYPKGEQGQAYVNEFWRTANQKNIAVGGVISYTPRKTDYRKPIQNLLGLQFSRERKEELGILNDVHSHQRNSVRRVQTLKPQIDFDWVFVPSIPSDALQLIPSFKYLDAYPLNIIGGPSWRSQKVLQASSKLGRLYFVGDDHSANEKAFAEKFKKEYKRNPRLLELRGYDSFKIISDLLEKSQFTSRDELDISIRSQTEFVALTGKWAIDDGIWIKKMTPLRLRGKKFERVFK